MESQDSNLPADTDSNAQQVDSELEALYRESLAYLQEGRWTEAIAGLEEIVRQRPDYADAVALLDESRLKATLEKDKPRAKRALPRVPVKRVLTIVVLGGMILILATGLRQAYRYWVQPRQTSQEGERHKAQLLGQAFKHLAERDYANAEQSLLAFLEDYPDNQEAREGLAKAQEKLALAENYSKAEQAMAQQDWNQASHLLAGIVSVDPRYKDAQQLQSLVQKQQELSTWFEHAEQAYRAGDWSEAIAAYDTLMTLDAEYSRGVVSQHLFDSCRKQAMHWVHSTKGEGEAVQKALDLYRKALILYPQHNQAIYEMALAERYLLGRTMLARGNLPEAIEALEWVYRQQPDYADGTVATILKAAVKKEHAPEPGIGADVALVSAAEGTFQERYTDSMQKGDEAVASGNYALAEQYYRQATTVAIHGGYESALWLFVAHVKLGTVQARQENYAQAVQTIKTAISIMSKSAVAIPESSYSDYVQQGDDLAQDGDYVKALEQYALAAQVFAEKCNCGLENWSILP